MANNEDSGMHSDIVYPSKAKGAMTSVHVFHDGMHHLDRLGATYEVDYTVGPITFSQ